MTGFYMPTKVRLGRGCVRAASDELREIASTWLVVTSAHAARSCGALEDVEAALTKAGAAWAVFDQVTENPDIACVYEGALLAMARNADGIIAIGGGSPMDAGKAIALLARNPSLPRERLFLGPYPGGALPVVCVPTTAGTGSEVTRAAILTNDVAHTKSSLSTPLIFPTLALVDARYLASVPRRVMVNTVIDALSHAVEGFLSAGANPVTDALALDAVGRIAGVLAALKAGTVGAEAHESAMAASTEAGMVIANTGTTAVHALGYSLTYVRGIPHGRANGLVLPSWLAWLDARMPTRVERVLGALGVRSVEEFDGILDDLIGEREHLSGDEISEFAGRAAQAGNIANCPIAPSADDLAAILRQSLG